MSQDISFHDYIMSDLLEGIPGVTSRAMFGGWAVYKDGIIFGIIADGELYFKATEENQADFERLQSRPFTYTKRGRRPITMPYRLVPPEILEDKEKLVALMEKSLTRKQSRKAE